MRRTLPAVIAAAVVVAGLAATTSGQSAGAATAPLPVLATGQITFPAGSATGQVLAFADPNQATLNADSTGTALSVSMVSSANAASDGSFTLTLDPKTIPANAVMPDGSVNMEVIAVSGGQQQVYFMPVKLAQVAVSNTATKAAFISKTNTSRPATANISFNMRGGSSVNTKYSPAKWMTESGHHFTGAKVARATTVNMTTKVKPTTAKLAASVAADSVVEAQADDVLPGVCLLHPGDYIYGRAEHFVNVYTQANVTAAHVSESLSATHSLGIAVDFGGTWHQNGTANISRSATKGSTSADHQQSWSYWNKVNYRKFLDSCAGAYQKPSDFYDILSADLNGATDMLWQGASCGVKEKGQTWDTQSAQAASFGTGVDLPVVNVSAQTGFASDENVHYKFLKKGEVAGNDKSGPLNSSKIEADDDWIVC